MAAASPTTDDPQFGPLVWDGFQHGGWGGSFVDERFADFGSAVPVFEESGEEDEDDDSELDDLAAAFGYTGEAAELLKSDKSTDFLKLLELKTAEALQKRPDAPASPSTAEDGSAAGLMDAMREMAERADAYDGSLDAERLAKVGRLKVVVANAKDVPPTDEQRAAWKQFRDGGAAIVERVVAEMAAVYRRQHAERVRWWDRIYGDPSDVALPALDDDADVRSLVRPAEFRVHPADAEGVAIGIQFECTWDRRGFGVRLRDGECVAMGPEDVALKPPKLRTTIRVPPFGELWRERYGGWLSRYRTEYIRGECSAAEWRSFFNKYPEHRHLQRDVPGWTVIDGDYSLSVNVDDWRAEAAPPPTAKQCEAWAAFTADDRRTGEQVYRAIFVHWNSIRDEFVEGMDEEEADATLPLLTSLDGVNELFELQDVTVQSEREAGGQTPAIILVFAWEDEHGMGVRWREGKVEYVGDPDTATDG